MATGVAMFSAKVDGVAPLIMHSVVVLIDKDHPTTRRIAVLTGKGKRMTEEDRQELYRLEATAGLYLNAEGRPYVPGNNIDRCILDAARREKLGKLIERGFLSDDALLVYDGPTTAAALWADPKFRFIRPAANGQRTIMRARTWFQKWSFTTRVTVDTRLLDVDTAKRLFTAGIETEGLMDWRPRHGRGRVVSIADVTT